MIGFVFNHRDGRVFELYYPYEDVPHPSEHHHTFGGDSCHEGTVPPEGKHPVHLFYRIDLRDPRVGQSYPHLNLNHLPLYYPLGNLGGPFLYRVVSDDRIEILCQPYPKEHRKGGRYPKPFRRRIMYLGEHRYDPTNPKHVHEYAGVLGIAALSDEQKAELRVKMDEWFAANLPHRSLMEDYVVEEGDEGEYDEIPLEELVAKYSPFTQGMPGAVCPNPACEWYGSGRTLPVVAYMEPERGDPFYKRLAGGDSGQLIWSACPSCASVSVDNPCT